MNGVLEFIDTSDFTSMGTGEHFQCTDVEWDPTGRYIITGVSWWAHKVDNAYWMWNFQGKILKRYSDQFNAKDKMRQNKASKELVAKRQKMIEDYSAWRDRKSKEFEESREKRLELRR